MTKTNHNLTTRVRQTFGILWAKARRIAATVPLAGTIGLAPFAPALAADLPPSLGSRSDPLDVETIAYGNAIGRSSLRPVPREWIAADAASIVDRTELVVLTPDEAAADDVAARAEPLGYRVIRRDTLSALGQVMTVLHVPQDRRGVAAIREVEQLVARATAGLNHGYLAPRAESTFDRFRYADAMIGWPTSGCAPAARIGLVDTGIDPEAAAALGADITTADFRRSPTRQVGTDHGTTLAALLAGPGRLRKPEIFSAVVTGNEGTLEDAAGVDDILRALDWLAGENVRVVNISLAGPYNKLLDLGIQSATQSGLIIVAAVGNDGPSSIPRFPAAFEEVVAVTAVDADAEVYARAVHGPHIDFAAPGVDVIVPLGDSPRFVTGTSVAAPFVTAALAANANILDDVDPVDFVATLSLSARDVGEAGRDDVFGFGILLADGRCP